MQDIESLLPAIRQLHESVRQAVTEACEQTSPEAMSQIAREKQGDTIYEVDRISESLLVEILEREIAPFAPLVLIAEGIPTGQIVLPRGVPERQAKWRIIVDPIDGTRGLMYQKRSAWILTGVAPNLGPETGLQDIQLAIQTEIPLVKQYLADMVWAVRGQGVHAERLNRITGERDSIQLQPSRARTIAHGFATISRFFPGVREEIAAIDEEIIRQALGPVQPGKAHCFEDQYICTGGQLYELMAGHDRFVADIRPLMEVVLHQRGLSLGICCHPYDICTESIAREMGIIVTDAAGGPLQIPLNVDTDVAWVGYANAHIQEQIEPKLQAALNGRGLLARRW
jgi:fructose-1,6-bisphosphatase/inositol monophosphatase family enzyme